MPFLSPNQQCQSLWRENITSFGFALPQAHLGVFQLCLWPLISPGNFGRGLPCLSSALWCQYPYCQFLNMLLSNVCRFSPQCFHFWHCWLGDRKGIRPVKKLDVDLLVVMIWLELCMSAVVTTTSITLSSNEIQNGDILVKVKVNVHTVDTAPLRSESPPQKRSGMARVLKGFHSFSCTPTRSSAIGISHNCLCLPSYSWYSFTDPGGMEGWVDLGVK